MVRGYMESVKDIILVFLLGCIGCAPVIQYAVPVKSNPQIFDEVVNKAINKFVEICPYIVKEKTYSIIDMSKGDTEDDEPLKVYISDALRIALTEKKAIVAERDEDILLHLILEEGGENLTSLISSKFKKTHLKFLTPTLEHTYKPTFLDDISLYSKGEEAYYLGTYFLDAFKKSTIKVSEYTIAFRIYEAGVRIFDDDTSDNDLKREASINLLIEILDTKKGFVLWAKRINEVLSDKIPIEAFPYLEDGGFVFFPHLLLKGESGKGNVPLKLEEKFEIYQEKGKEEKKEKTLKGIRFQMGFATGINTLIYEPVFTDVDSYGYDFFIGYDVLKYFRAGIRTSGTFDGFDFVKVSGEFDGRIPYQHFEISAGVKIGDVYGRGNYSEHSFFFATGIMVEYFPHLNFGGYVGVDYGIHQIFSRIDEEWIGGKIGGLLTITAGISSKL